MENIIENLKNNFLFQASLGSKELFHSNLIAWILEQENEYGEYEALKIFLKTINAKVPLNSLKKENEIKISREENNIDLIIKWKENEQWNFVFIENKMKSIPTSDQLKKYNEKIEKNVNHLNVLINNKFLLTPLSTLLQNDEHTDKWINITYKEEIIEFLNQIKNLNFKNPDIKLVVEKYIDFLNNIILLFKSYIGIDNNEFSNKNYDFYTKNKLDNLKHIRMHDLILKAMHERLGLLIKNKINNPNLKIETHFTRAEGITDIFYEIKNTDYIIGMQIQGNTLKHCMISKKIESNLKNIELSKKLVEKKLWFHDFSKNPPNLMSGNGKDKNNLGLKIDNSNEIFCEYSKGHFLYLSKSLKEFEDKPIFDLVNLIVEEFKQFINNKDKIIKIVNEF